MKIWIGILSGIFLLWGVAILHIFAFELDVRLFGLFKEERTYPILINAFFVVLLGAMTSLFPLKWKIKVFSLTFFSLSFASILLMVGLEWAVLGIFGSPKWESIQRWASESYPEKSWVQESWRVPQSGCGAYCQDVHTWIKIRAIIVE